MNIKPVYFDSRTIPESEKLLGVDRQIEGIGAMTLGDRVLMKNRASGLQYPMTVVKTSDNFVWVDLGRGYVS